MERSDWETLVEQAPIRDLKGRVWRIVESQEQKATTDLVSDLEKQGILEDLLDQSKPPYPDGSQNLHYLLSTPFRYPPLQWGSRFGNRFEPSLFYASFEIETMLAEKAYYQFLFWQGMETPLPSGKIISQHNVFSVTFHANPALELQTEPFEPYQDILRSRNDYRSSQTLGSVLRDKGIKGFTFTSARCPKKGLNAALFTPKALASQTPETEQNWLSDTRPDTVSFRGPEGFFRFGIELFCENSRISHFQ